MNIRQYLLYKQAAGDEIMLPEGADAPTPGPMDDTAPAGRSFDDNNNLSNSIDTAYDGFAVDDKGSFKYDPEWQSGTQEQPNTRNSVNTFNSDTEFDNHYTNYLNKINPTDENEYSWDNYSDAGKNNAMVGLNNEGYMVDGNGQFRDRSDEYADLGNNEDIMNELSSGTQEQPDDLYRTEAGTLPNPVSQPANTEMSLEDYGKQDMANSDNYQAEANNNRAIEEFSNQDIADSNYQNPEANQSHFYQPQQTAQQPQRPSYQAMQQNKQELQEWDDHYNAIKQNIMNPGQIRRWEANGFTRDQMEAYADREARKKATNRYGNRPNDIMEEYNYNMNAQASPQQQFGYQPMDREQMMTAQNKPPASSQERLREGNPIYDREVSRLNEQIAKLQQRIQSGRGPFNKARNKLLARRKLSMVQNYLDGIKSQGLAPDGSFKGVRRMGKWSLQ